MNIFKQKKSETEASRILREQSEADKREAIDKLKQEYFNGFTKGLKRNLLETLEIHANALAHERHGGIHIEKPRMGLEACLNLYVLIRIRERLDDIEMILRA